MLPESHHRAYQDLLTLLTEFNTYLIKSDHQEEQTSVKRGFETVSHCFEEQIMKLDNQDMATEVSGRWQSVQTEIKREFQLLTVDILFLASARQQQTRSKRINQIKQHLAKLIGYCQIMLADSK